MLGRPLEYRLVSTAPPKVPKTHHEGPEKSIFDPLGANLYGACGGPATPAMAVTPMTMQPAMTMTASGLAVQPKTADPFGPRPIELWPILYGYGL